MTDFSYKNAKFDDAEGASITMDYEHPDLGWVPYTARGDDAISADLFNAVKAAGDIAAYVPVPPPVPRSVTLGQAKLALHRAGLLPTVEAAIAAMEGNEGIEARINWAYRNEIEMDHPLVSSMASALGIPQEQLVALFVWAADL